MDIRESRHIRLQYVEGFLESRNLLTANVVFSPESVEFISRCDSVKTFLDNLWRSKITSINYTRRNLLMDTWYITRTKSTSIHMDSTGDGFPWMFRIILQSLLDLKSGRPCDLGIWRKDIPSDFNNCTESDHICYEFAERHLSELNDEAEELAGLSVGRVKYLLKQIKKDPVFTLPDLLNSL
jgi:hypothetical protein